MRISDWSSDVCSSDLLERGSPGCADMVAHLADHLIRAALDVVIEYDADLLAREKVHKAGQMAKIEAIFQKARDAGFRADQTEFGLGRHRAAPDKRERKRVVEEKRGSVLVDIGGSSSLTKKKRQDKNR